MREIKFRAWDKDRNKMFIVATVSKYYGIEADCAVDDDGNTTIWNAILMQYAGLKDKNAKEIYEGDIVKDSCGYIGDIRFINGAFCIWHINTPAGWNNQYYPVFMGMEDEEIIGNIYENPELLRSEI